MIINEGTKVIQMVAAPKGITANYEWYNNDEDFGEIGWRSDCYPVVCFALVERDGGQEIVPVVNDDTNPVLEGNFGIALADELKCFRYCDVDYREKIWTVVKCHDGSVCPVCNETAITLSAHCGCEGIGNTTVDAVKDGIHITLGAYRDADSARIALNDLMDSVGRDLHAEIMSVAEADSKVRDWIKRKERAKAIQLFTPVFTGRYDRVLADAGFRTVEDVKNASDEQLLRLRNIGPKAVKDIRERIKKWELKTGMKEQS